MKSVRALIADGVFPGVASLLFPMVEGLGFDLSVAGSPAEIADSLPEIELLILKNYPASADNLGRARKLRGVQKLGMLTDTVDARELANRRIPFRTLSLPSAVAVADHTLALMLALWRQLDAGGAAMRAPAPIEPIVTDERRFAYNWAGIATTSLTGKILGLIGFGEVAAEVARRARAFGMRVNYTKRSPLPAATERRLGVRFEPLDTLLKESDILSVHIPHTAETVGLIGARQLAAMKPGAFLINTARGAIVDEAALVKSLVSGHLGGAGLDVFAVEPLPVDSPLLMAPRVIATPHVAGAGSEALAAAIAGCLRRWRRTLGSGDRPGS